jgi:predicted nucleotidyltransferase
MERNDIITCLRARLPDLRERFGVKRIGLFGSVLTDQFSDRSDIDLIVEFERPIGFAFFDLVEHLEEILGRRVDVLTPDGVGSIRIPAVAETIRNTAIYV